MTKAGNRRMYRKIYLHIKAKVMINWSTAGNAHCTMVLKSGTLKSTMQSCDQRSINLIE